MLRNDTNVGNGTLGARGLGFALENFDAVGQWRTVDIDGTPIDASASLPDGTKFTGSADLRELLLTRREEFVGAFVDKLFLRTRDYLNYNGITTVADYATRYVNAIEGITENATVRLDQFRQR